MIITQVRLHITHYTRKDRFSKLAETRKGEISISFPQFLLLDWKESNIWHVSEDELRAVVLTRVQWQHQKARSRWRACGWGVDFWDSRRNKGRIAGYWENCKCTRARLHACLATLCCTSIWDMNTLEGYQLVGGMWWDNNTLRWLIGAWWKLLFISSYSSPLCYESSDAPETEQIAVEYEVLMTGYC